MWIKQTLLPISERGALKNLAGGFCVLVFGFALLYFGNLQVERVTARLEGGELGTLLFCSTLSVLVHGSQIFLLVLGWVTIGAGTSYYFSQVPLAANLAISSLGIWASLTALPILSPQLTYTFPLNPFALLLLVAIFQIFTIYVENWLDKSAAMMLVVYSFQSLELLPVLPADAQALGQYGDDIVVASIAGMTLFSSFMAGATISVWVLARYSIRLGQVRYSWTKERTEDGANTGGLRDVNMVDIRSLVHDLKNPLAAIKGIASMLKNSSDGGTAEKGHTAFKAANYMERMIAELLDEGRRRDVPVESFFSELERHIRPFPWGEYVGVNMERGVERLNLSLNEIYFMRALLNVLDNAWRANLTAGQSKITVNVRRGSSFLEIEILDNGPGYVDKGAPYQKSGWGSTGLGLAFARKTVTAHDGSLVLSERTDGMNGARVLISVPVSDTSQRIADVSAS